MSTILVPTDFSEVASNAAIYAAKMASDIQADIVLLHAYNIPISLSEVPMPLLSDEEMREASHEGLENVAAMLRKEGFQGAIRFEIGKGDFVSVLQETIETVQPLIVLMGITGKSEFETLLMGSNTFGAIRNLMVPVMVVPREASFRPVKRIAVALDLKNMKETIPAEQLLDMSGAMGATVHFVHIDSGNDYPNSDTAIHLDALKHAFPDAVCHFSDNLSLVDGLNNYVYENGIDLLVMFPRKHNFFELLFNSSSTRKMALHTNVPLVTMHR
jgi:nucleotide-binding universal stress UspA family protein